MRLVVSFMTLIAVLSGWSFAQAQQDFQAMMKEYLEKYAAPGEHHKHLERLAGKWTAQTNFWPAPGAPAIEATGTAEHEMILGGRFLRTSYQSKIMGQPFTGLGTAGYDRYTKKYVETWIDSMGTMTMVSEGSCENDGQLRTVKAEFDDPMTGKRTFMRSVYRILDPQHYVLEMYSAPAGGQEFKVMEIHHSRRQ